MSKQIKEAKKEGHNKLIFEDVKITKDIMDKVVQSIPNMADLRIVSFSSHSSTWNLQ
jgi:hypothetical protein